LPNWITVTIREKTERCDDVIETLSFSDVEQQSRVGRWQKTPYGNMPRSSVWDGFSAVYKGATPECYS